MAKRKFQKFDLSVANEIIETKELKQEDVESQLPGADAAAEEIEKVEEGEVVTESPSKVSKLLNELDKPVNKAYNFKFVRREKLIYHNNNTYPKESIEKLADTILHFGLLHNLEVLYDAESDLYTIESGERRTRALDLLIDTYKDYSAKDSKEYYYYTRNVMPFEQGYPCNVKRPEDTDNTELNEIESKIRLRIANEEQRGHDPVRTQEKVVELKELYEERNKFLQEDEKVNVNEAVGEFLNITDRQVKKYTAIEKLIPQLKDLFKAKKLTIAESSNYAQLTEEEQLQLYELIENGESKKTINDLSKQLNSLRLDMEKKETAIKRLEQEKKKVEEERSKAEKKASELTQTTEQIKEEIRKELAENDPNKEKIKALEISLRNANEKHDAQQEEIKKKIKEKELLSKEQEKKIKDLQKKLKEKENGETKDIEYLKALGKLEVAITSINQGLDTLAEISDHIKQGKDGENIKIDAEIEKIMSKLETIKSTK